LALLLRCAWVCKGERGGGTAAATRVSVRATAPTRHATCFMKFRLFVHRCVCFGEENVARTHLFAPFAGCVWGVAWVCVCGACCVSCRQLAFEAAVQGQALLSNLPTATPWGKAPLLPLQATALKGKTVAVIGPNANITQVCSAAVLPPRRWRLARRARARPPPPAPAPHPVRGRRAAAREGVHVCAPAPRV
jgi:hypothetical protein